MSRSVSRKTRKMLFGVIALLALATFIIFLVPEQPVKALPTASTQENSNQND